MSGISFAGWGTSARAATSASGFECEALEAALITPRSKIRAPRHQNDSLIARLPWNSGQRECVGVMMASGCMVTFIAVRVTERIEYGLWALVHAEPLFRVSR